MTALDEKRNAELTRFASSVVSDPSSLQCTGSEPDFTNYAQIREDPVFIECLDYIFHSPSLKVRFPSPSPPLPSFLHSPSMPRQLAR